MKYEHWSLPVFTTRCYASAVLAMGLCPCLSVTSRCSTKTARRRIIQTTPHDTPRDSSFLMPKISLKFDRGHPLRGHQMQVGWVKQWRRQKEEVGWALASVRQPNAKGYPLPIRLGGLGERRKRGLGRSPSRNRFWCILPLKSDLWCQQQQQQRPFNGL